MLKQKKRVKTLLLGVTLSLIAGEIFLQTKTDASSNVERLWGNSRYDTSIKISKKGWAKSDTVILVAENSFADALASSPLSKRLNAPVFLTPYASLEKKDAPENLKTQISNLNAKKAIIIGGENALSQNIEKELSTLGITSERISGKNRYDTSVKIAEKLGLSSNVALVNGYSFADGLSIAPVAAIKNMPIILVDKDSVPKEVKSFMNNKDYSNVYVCGGEYVVSSNVTSNFSNIVRFNGTNRYHTNAKILEYFSSSFNKDNVYVATGEDFPDALSGAALAAKNGQAMLLTSPTPNTYAKSAIATLFPQFDKNNITVFGGERVVPNSTIDILKQASRFEVESIE